MNEKAVKKGIIFGFAILRERVSNLLQTPGRQLLSSAA